MCPLRFFENLSRSILPEGVFYFVWILNSYTALFYSIVWEAVVALFFILSGVSLAVNHYFILFFFKAAISLYNYSVPNCILQCITMYCPILQHILHCISLPCNYILLHTLLLPFHHRLHITLIFFISFWRSLFMHSFVAFYELTLC